MRTYSGFCRRKSESMIPELYGGIVEVSAALREFYGLERSAESDPAVSAWLKDNHFRCVIALLIDGMGISVMEKHLKTDSFFRSHTAKVTTTVFPPTTTAATTAFLTGKYPCETGWLGWNQYFPEINDEVILFRNAGQYSGKQYPGYSWNRLPVKFIHNELEEKGIHAVSWWPEWGGAEACHSYRSMMNRIVHSAEDPSVRMIYAYWDHLDTCMHLNGPSSALTGRMATYLESETAKMAQQLPEDCGLLVIADHSQIEVKHYYIDEDDEFCSYLRQAPTIEARAVSFYIRPEKKDEFREYFRRKFRNAFLLIDHDTVLNSGWFGKGDKHPMMDDFIGDYLAVALTHLQLDYIRGKDTRGNHAGGMRKEAEIPVILVP